MSRHSRHKAPRATPVPVLLVTPLGSAHAERSHRQPVIIQSQRIRYPSPDTLDRSAHRSPISIARRSPPLRPCLRKSPEHGINPNSCPHVWTNSSVKRWMEKERAPQCSLSWPHWWIEGEGEHEYKTTTGALADAPNRLTNFKGGPGQQRPMTWQQMKGKRLTPSTIVEARTYDTGKV